MSLKLRPIALVGVTALSLFAGLAVAQEGPTPEEMAVRAREAHMRLYAFNLGKLGGMAGGDMEYDSATAQAAADNLHHMVQLSHDGYWIEGTAQGEVEGSDALPAIWENMEDFQAKHQALVDAVTNLQTTAGTDLAGLQGAMEGVGQACGGCHEDYRAKDE